LEQFIVQVLGNPGSFREPFFESGIQCRPDLTDSNSIDGPREGGQQPATQKFEVSGLIEGRQNREGNACSLLVPDTIIIRSKDSKAVCIGAEICIKCLPSRACQFPVGVVSFKPGSATARSSAALFP